MDTTTIMGLVARHALTTLAGWLVSQGIIQSSGAQGFIGACLLVLGVLWSWYQKQGQVLIAAELDRLKAVRRTAVALLALALSGGFMGDLRAANLASPVNPFTKASAAPAVPACTLTSCTGLFAGGFLANAGGNLDVIGTGLTGLAQNGLGFGGQVGGEYFANNIYAAFYVDLQDDMQINAPPGTSFASRLTFGIGGRLGYSLASAFGAATTGTTTPTLPQQFLASLMTPYINVWEGKRHDQGALRTGAGVEALLSTNNTLNADYLHYSYNQGGSAGTLAGVPVKLTNDNEFRLSFNHHFGF